jgi:hypothetical protein
LSFQYQTDPVDEHENVLGVFYGNRGQWGAQFVVTNRRLLLGPLDVGVAEDILHHLLGKTGVPDLDFAKSLLEKYGPRNPKTIWLRHVTDARPSRNAGVLGAAGISIRTDTDEAIDLKIVHKPTAPNWTSENNAARDRFVLTLREAVESAKAAPPPSG